MAHNWVTKTSDQLVYEAFPWDAIQGGYEADNTPMYVGRALHECHYLPARIMPGRNFAYYGNNWQQFKKANFDVLIGDRGYAWVSANNGNVPPNAVGGFNSPNQNLPLYIGRAMHEGVLCLGKVNPAGKCIYLQAKGIEVKATAYEVLVHEGCSHVPLWKTMSSTDAIPRDAFQLGNDADGSFMYVGRVYLERHIVPARIVTGKTYAYVATSHVLYKKTKFDFLLGDRKYSWVSAKNGAIPPNAVSDCTNLSNDTIYIGRAPHQDFLCIGKINPKNKCIYLPQPNKEIGVNSYEVLVSIPQHCCH